MATKPKSPPPERPAEPGRRSLTPARREFAAPGREAPRPRTIPPPRCGANVMYFLSAPVRRIVSGEEPLSREALAQRRKLLVEFLGQAIFQDRQHGAELAAKVFGDTPMPETTLPDKPSGGNLAARVLAD